MKRVFICQPYPYKDNRKNSGKTVGEYDSAAWKKAKEIFPDEDQLLQANNPLPGTSDYKHMKTDNQKGIYNLGSSICKLAIADAAFFPKDYTHYKGCSFEYDIAVAYNIPVYLYEV